jgi:hypothetical protein
MSVPLPWCWRGQVASSARGVAGVEAAMGRSRGRRWIRFCGGRGRFWSWCVCVCWRERESGEKEGCSMRVVGYEGALVRDATRRRAGCSCCLEPGIRRSDPMIGVMCKW